MALLILIIKPLVMIRTGFIRMKTRVSMCANGGLSLKNNVQILPSKIIFHCIISRRKRYFSIIVGKTSCFEGSSCYEKIFLPLFNEISSSRTKR